MKKGIILIIPILCFITAYLVYGKRKNNIPVSSKGFALIELFTSEGCSSCPPAEAVMHRLIRKAAGVQNAETLPVYVIEFHVDYWNYLGWKDSFSTPEYSKRQQEYKNSLKLNTVYTPQAIINGETEMTGSDEAKINASIAKTLQKPAWVTIDCKANKTGNSKIEIVYNVTGNITGTELNVALVESNLATLIKRGENVNRNLTHDNVARVFKTIKLNSLSGRTMLNVPHINLLNAKLICYLQNTENRKIIGATEVGNIQ